MTAEKNEFQVWRTARPDTFTHDGKVVTLPEYWTFVPAGDPGLTRRLKTSGEYWLLVHRRRNRIESLGLYTDAARVNAVKAALSAERADPAYQQKLDSARRSRAAKQDAYVVEFRSAVMDFLHFAPRYQDLAWSLADAVTDQAVPVGSGTVARTSRIPVERRAEAAVIAWMRHQTTAYDHMTIARIKGERREVRRMLAARSRQILADYRAGRDVDSSLCPLAVALNSGTAKHEVDRAHQAERCP